MMAKRPSPTKSTGGGGFAFEDKVGAYFLAHLLTNTPPFRPELGTISKVSFQQSSQGWLLDDLVLSLDRESGEYFCAFSIKSNQQVNRNGVNSEMIRSVWKQYLDEGSRCFDRTRDRLGFICAPPSPQLGSSVDEILGKVQDMEPKELTQHFSSGGSTSILTQKVFASFDCPRKLAKAHRPEDTETGFLLRSIEVLTFDFENVNSEQEKAAGNLCRGSLISDDLSEANQLWLELKDIVNDLRQMGGSIDLERLLDRLRYKFDLKSCPNYEPDLRILADMTTRNLNLIKDTFGDHVRVPRTPILENLSSIFSKSSSALLTGPSGCGKSVLLKRFAEERNSRVVFIRGSQLIAKGTDPFEKSLGLKHSLKDILKTVPDTEVYLIVDGLEKLKTDEDFSELSLMSLEEASDHLKVLFSCEEKAWNSVDHQLRRWGIRLNRDSLAQLDYLEPDELKSLIDEFPFLRKALRNKEIFDLFKRPKILDFILSRSLSDHGNTAQRWAGETDFVEWWWEELVRPPNSCLKSECLKSLATIQGDDGSFSTSTSKIDRHFLGTLDSFEETRTCVIEQGQIRFEHDLLGGWTRYILLRDNSGELFQFLKGRLSSYLWHHPVRLLGLDYLSSSEGISDWLQVLNHSDGTFPHETRIVQDLFLESVFHAQNLGQSMNRVWKTLKENEGEFLKRLLRRFKVTASLPNPEVIEILLESGVSSKSTASTYRRIPIPHFWVPMLLFLHSKKDELVLLCPSLIAEIASSWLLETPPGTRFRKEAAETAVYFADALLVADEDSKAPFLPEEDKKTIFRAAIQSFPDLPEKVSNIVLKASSREWARDPSKVETTTEIYEIGGKRRKVELPMPHPDGPSARVDRAFQDLCLDENGLVPLFHNAPDRAKEVILALLIQPPHSKVSNYQYHDRGEINDAGHFYPPFYSRGPFLTFLQADRSMGVQLITDLVNFATLRYLESIPEKMKGEFTTEVSRGGTPVEWYGDGNVFCWFLNTTTGPNAVISALMSLEYFLYEELKAGNDIHDILVDTLERSRSVAFASLLLSVGKRCRSLLVEDLIDLLGVLEFHLWDYYTLRHDTAGILLNSHLMKGTKEFEDARKWYSLKHRSLGLKCHLGILLTQPRNVSGKLDTARNQLRLRLSQFKEGDPLRFYTEKIIAELDPSNWTVRQVEDQLMIVCDLPGYFHEAGRKQTQQSEESMRLIDMPYRSLEVLKARAPLSPGETEIWLELLDQLKNVSSSVQPWRIGAAVTGCAAVLACFGDLECKRDFDWHKQVLEHVVTATKRLHDCDDPITEGNYEGDKVRLLCAWSIPYLWSRNIRNRDLREGVALLATCDQHDALAALYEVLESRKGKLGDNYNQLYRLSIHWAHRKYRLPSFYQTVDTNELKQSMNWLKNARSEFVRGSGSLAEVDWDELALSGDERENRRYPMIDLDAISSIHAARSNYSQCKDERARQDCFHYWSKCLRVLTWSIERNRNSDDCDERFPSEWDNFTLEGLARLSLEIASTEQSNQITGQLLKIGPKACSWVQRFITSFFLSGFREDQPTPECVERWQEIIRIANDSGMWVFGSGGYDRDCEKFWTTLFCLDWNLLDLWDSVEKATIEKILPLIENWGEESFTSEESAAQYCCLLCKDIGNEFRSSGLLLLSQHAEKWRDRALESFHLDQELTRLLETVWNSGVLDRGMEGETNTSFRNLLLRLVTAQYPPAMELLSTTSSSSV